jgi:DNA polymerase (family 10)
LRLALEEGRPAVRGSAFAAALERARADIIPLGRGADLLESLASNLRAHVPGLDAIEPAGGLRRYEPLLDSLAVVARATDPPAAIAAIARMRTMAAVLHRTGRRLIVEYQGTEVDIRVAAPEEYGTVLFASTGPATHVAAVLRRSGPRLSASEDAVYTQAGLHWLPPERRDQPDALELAHRGEAGRLVTRRDIRGDLHMHSSYSDGRDALQDMVAAGAALGYEYIAITDHSEHAAASRTLDADQLARQADEIARLRERFPRLAILHGIEADILPDGRIDCPDDVLARLDIVVASLHERCGHDGARLTARCIRAIRHPLVSVITHPTNQLVGRRPPYDMDYDAIYAAAAETGTILEIDGAPTHLDLDSRRAADAVAAGVTVSIDSDCHRARALARQMDFGVGTARRGGIRPDQVINTRPLSEVRAFIQRKRTPAC